MSFKAARKKTGKSQAMVAKDFGVNQSTVALWEMGKTSPRAELLLKIAQYYDCSVESLLTGNGEESHENENQPVASPNKSYVISVERGHEIAEMLRAL